MALQKQPININFAKGLDTKTDPYQVPIGNFVTLQNTIFTKGGLLSKRNGFNSLDPLPDATTVYATTFSGNLLAVGNKVESYSEGSGQWINQGSIQPLELATQSIIRNSTNQSQVDSVVSASGLVCSVYTDQLTTSLSTPVYKYVITDQTTGQNVIPPTVISVTTGTVTGSPRVFLLGNYFIIVFNNVISAVNHLQYIAVSIGNPTIVTANINISSSYTPSGSGTIAFDGVVANNNLYLAWNSNDPGGSIKMAYLDFSLILHLFVTFGGRVANNMAVCADVTGSTAVIYAVFYDSASSTGYVLAVNQALSTVLNPTLWTSATGIVNITASAQNQVATIYYEKTNAYSYDSGIPTNLITKLTVSQTGTVGTPSVFARSLGLASKSFILNNSIYVLAAYSSAYQPAYYLLDSSGLVIAKLAYQNGGGYLTKGLPGVTIQGTAISIPYLYKDLIASVNKNTNVPSGSQVAGIYSQTGINIATFQIGTSNIYSSEIGNNLHLTGGFLWMYDGYNPVEHNFFVYPENVEATWSTIGGSVAAKPDGSTNTNAYFYQVTYEWADNQGNIHRSAPSVPISVTTTGSSSTGSITINVPTLRLTYKTDNPVKIVIYRWSVAQQIYYQVTSITAPIINNTAVDSVSFVDTSSDATILGNSIIYTTGGVVENISAPACKTISLFDDRLFLLSSEDGSLWYSKQVVALTPVEMSDLFTIYVAPTIGASGSTGKITCMFPMDDKLILFKKDAIYYINGMGPDNTGANSQYSQPIFVTGTVGCVNQQSIVLMPNGLMFQSDKGIWLLGRNLETTYIGAPVEAYNSNLVNSALTIPGTNQVRFCLTNSDTLVYDYFYGQWSTFVNLHTVVSTLYRDLHTYIDKMGNVFQETPGSYTDGSEPVLMKFTTSWINLAGLQGYQRAYMFYLLGTYISPHKLTLTVAYDYNPSPTQQTIITPTNYNYPYGTNSPYGQGTPYGGQGAVEQWKVFLQRQTCQSFQITLQESFDYQFQTDVGAGFTMSGINCVVGLKKGYVPIRGNSVG